MGLVGESIPDREIRRYESPEAGSMSAESEQQQRSHCGLSSSSEVEKGE